MNSEEKRALATNDLLYATIDRLYCMETGSNSSTQISYIIKRANLPVSVVLGALYLAVSARERAALYISKLRKEMATHVVRREVLQKRINSCLSLCENSTILFSISLILSSKYLVDRAYVNRTWSNILMIDRAQINNHERTLLYVFDHKIDISSQSIRGVLKKIENTTQSAPKKESGFLCSIKKAICCIFGQSSSRYYPDPM